jgi:hypothetical protein
LSGITVVTLADVPPVELAGGSWSRVLVAEQTVGGNASALGYSVFKPGTSTADLSHSVEDLACIASPAGDVQPPEVAGLETQLLGRDIGRIGYDVRVT